MKRRFAENLMESLNDHEVLIRLNTFLVLYFGWIGFTVLYDHIKSHSRDVTYLLLKLPFTSYKFVVTTLDLTKDFLPIYFLMKAIYYIGFSGSIALTVFFVLIYKRDLQKADELALGYLVIYSICGAIYTLVHVYAPHYVYNLPGFYPDRTYLTQQEFVLPSLHNTVAAFNIIILWKYRRELTAKLIIALNSLVPFATLLLGHHWIYDALSGIVLAVIVGRLVEGKKIRVPSTFRSVNVSIIKHVTMLGFLAGGFLLILAITMPKP
ncbi:phosphatase PAP2 family protein [Thermococcus sp. AM4]|uniref:phosphatase PAP2 family protein n=1 Tax=Thermococcus sp. (strain AM4) TaxID=246969 RepID=UPI0002299424|nr:phosphatase PAP2 family protein [Thermococcus sp. AM4]EEB73256.2 Membrane-bound phosphoesterase PAP2 superfamily [Thermococcus sp. AM4]